MTEVKNPFASKSIWGAIFMIAGLIGGMFGVDVPKEELQGIVDILSTNWHVFSEIFGLILSVWGRVTAKTKLGFKSVAGGKNFFLLLFCAAFLLSSCCTSKIVHDEETGEETKKLDCLSPGEMALAAVAVPYILLTDPFN